VYLGEWKSEEAATAYAKVIADFARPRPVPALDGKLSVAELIAAFKGHVEQYYRRPDGTPTFEVDGFRQSLRPVRELFGSKAAEDFGPLDLEAVRDRMIAAGLCRTLINRRIGRVKRCFKWGVAKQIVPPHVLVGLTSLEGLRPGRSQARETAPVRPVSEDVVRATLPYLARHIAGLVRFQLYTGCRPGEACLVRRSDLDTSGPIWLYRPAYHKLAYRGTARVIPIGPKAQEVINEFRSFNPTAYVFDPAAAVREFHASRSDTRETPLFPSHAKRNTVRRVKVGKRAPGTRYTTASYGKAVAAACDRAFSPPDHLARQEGETLAAWNARLTDDERAELKAWRLAHRWHPNQLRHRYASLVRKQFGLEAAQVTLGHVKANVTEIYAERNMALASKVAEAVG
jgi:integrase